MYFIEDNLPELIMDVAKKDKPYSKSNTIGTGGYALRKV